MDDSKYPDNYLRGACNMSTPESETKKESSSVFSTGKALIAAVVLAAALGVPWWVTMIPEFNFTQ